MLPKTTLLHLLKSHVNLYLSALIKPYGLFSICNPPNMPPSPHPTTARILLKKHYCQRSEAQKIDETVTFQCKTTSTKMKQLHQKHQVSKLAHQKVLLHGEKHRYYMIS